MPFSPNPCPDMECAARCARFGSEADPIVAHVEQRHIVHIGEGDADLGGFGVLGHVRQRFLGDPKQRDFQIHEQWRRVAGRLEMQRDGRAFGPARGHVANGVRQS